MVDFAYKLKSLRELNGWSQEELARRLEVSRSKIGNYEQGTREPSFEDLEAIADVFNCTICYLVGGEDNVSPLSKEDSELLDLFRNLNPAGRKQLLKMARLFAGSEEYKLKGDDLQSSNVIC